MIEHVSEIRYELNESEEQPKQKENLNLIEDLDSLIKDVNQFLKTAENCERTDFKRKFILKFTELINSVISQIADNDARLRYEPVLKEQLRHFQESLEKCKLPNANDPEPLYNAKVIRLQNSTAIFLNGFKPLFSQVQKHLTQTN